MKCTNCNNELPYDASKCPFCGMYYARIYLDPPVDLGGTISAFSASGAVLMASHADSPPSPSAYRGEEEFKQYWVQLPDELSRALVEGPQAVKKLDQETKRRNKATRITYLIGASNALFISKKKAVFFNEEHPILISQLFSPCESLDSFPTKVAGLYSFFEVELDPLRNLVSDPGDLRSIKLVKKWLDEENISYNPKMIECWEKIGELRNLAPLHAKKHEDIVSILTFFGVNSPLKYERFWDSILDIFLSSLEEWYRIVLSIQ